MARDTTEPGADEAEIDLDQPSGATIDLTRLYTLWEANNWSAYAIDLSEDARDWRERVTEPQRVAARWNYAMFVQGEEAVARTLAPFITAAPTQEQRIFLTTQIVDEARHHVFFDRVMREVLGESGGYEEVLAAIQPELTQGFRRVFGELDRLTDHLRRQPTNLALYAQCIALYHIVVEGTLAHPGQHFMLEYLAKFGIMPGFREGIAHIARDESRHMAFGIQALSELVKGDVAIRRGVIRLLNRVLPWAVTVLAPPNLDFGYLRSFDIEVEDLYAFSLRSLETKLTRAGIAPGEVVALVKLGADEPARMQGERALALLKAGMVGDVAPLLVNEETQALLFGAIERVANMRPSSALPVIQWDFSDTEPWYLAPDGERARAQRGRAPAPALTLRCTAKDWARIATEKLDPRLALLRRRLTVSGDWRLTLRLQSLLGA